jgi:hypothetical protein
MRKMNDVQSTKVRKVYNVDQRRQLIDLNQDTVNFDLTFKVVSTDKVQFQGVVVDQMTLDTNPNLEFMPSKDGKFGGTIHQNENVFKNFFLVLKAEKPCQCEVEINKTPLPILQVAPSTPPKESSSFWWWLKIALYVLIGAGAIYVVWQLFFRKKDGEQNPAPEETLIASPEMSPIASPIASPVASPKENSQAPSPILPSSPAPVAKTGKSLLVDKLRKLQLD